MIHSPDRGSGSDLPGREKARLYGGDGTPVVSEFAAAQLGARIGRTTFAAGQLMADALDLVHRGTDLWARVQTGRVRASYARHVVARTRHLSKDEAQYVATAVAESADGRIPWTRFEALVEAKVAQANPGPRLEVSGAGITAPILMLNETQDGATPAAGALAARALFPSAALVAGVGGTSHAVGLHGIPCTDNAIADLLRDGSLPERRSGNRADKKCPPLPPPDPSARGAQTPGDFGFLEVGALPSFWGQWWPEEPPSLTG